MPQPASAFFSVSLLDRRTDENAAGANAASMLWLKMT